MVRPASEFNAHSQAPAERISVRVLDNMINASLDTSGLDAHVIAIEAVHSISPFILEKLEQTTLARLMIGLGLHANEQRGFGDSISPEAQEAGYALVKAARIPPDFFTRLQDCEAKLHEKMAGYHVFERLRVDAPMGSVFIDTFAQQFAQDFAESYGMALAPSVQVYRNAKDGNYGVCMFDAASQRSHVEVNAAKYQTMRDLPELVLTLGHELMHAYANAVVAGNCDLSIFDDDAKAQFQMLNIFNKTFYSAQRLDVYLKHGEEHLAEITGLGLAARTLRRMGFDVDQSQFAMSRAWLSDETIGAVVMSKGEAPMAVTTGGYRPVHMKPPKPGPVRP